MSEHDAIEEGADLGGFITSAEMDQQLLHTVPHYARLVEATVRRKRLLKATARRRERHTTQTALAETIGSRSHARLTARARSGISDGRGRPLAVYTRSGMRAA